MIFEGLNNLRRSSIMSSIILMAAGIIMMLCPEIYITALISMLGSVMIIISIVMILDFLDSNKSLVQFAFLTIALVVGIVGVVVLLYELDVLYVLGLVFGIFLILDGVHGIFHTMIYARRSQVKGWWILIPFSILLIIFGLIILLNPFWDAPGPFLKVIGLMIVFSSIVNALRLIWVWPIKSE